MTQQERETVSQWVFRQVGRAFLKKRDRLGWAVSLAQEPLAQCSPGRMYDLRIELAAFLAYGGGWRFGGDGDMPLPTIEELHAAQGEFTPIIGGVVQGESRTLGPYPATMHIRAQNGRATVRELLDLKQVSLPLQAGYALGRLLGELDRDLMAAGYLGPVIKVCPAPQARGTAAEPCGRWFVGRPNQVYCSSQCQNRAATRATRARASSEISETKRGRRKR
jgi:hypothetical protein